MARWKGSARSEPGEVLSVREDGASCAVLFDDQCYDENVPFASVRRMTVIEEVRAQKVRAAQFAGIEARASAWSVAEAALWELGIASSHVRACAPGARF